MIHRLTRAVWVVLIVARAALLGRGQQGCCGQTYHGAEFQVSNAEASVAFYHDVLGLEYPPGWTGKISPPGGGNSELTGALNGLIRVVSLPIPGASWHMQIVETTGIDRKAVAPRRQDVGATGLILYVRDLDRAVAALNKASASIVTMGGVPVNIAGKIKTRAIVAKDPDGFFIEIRQTNPLPETSVSAASNVIGARMSVSIADTNQTARYWSELFEFDVKPEASFSTDKTVLALYGTPGAQVRKSTATIRPAGQFMHSNPDLVFEFLEFKNINRRVLAPRYQDPGSGAFVLRMRTADPTVRGKEMAALVKRLRTWQQTKILTQGNNALDQGRRFAVFFQDLNGFILEATQYTP